MGGKVMPAREPTDVANLTQQLAAKTGPTPTSWTRLVLDWATAALMPASTAAIRCSSWRTSAIRPAASELPPAHQRA
jgi:hypothetical protein